ncbi:unnamed protein product, partial [Rotaria sp. Silwood1]
MNSQYSIGTTFVWWEFLSCTKSIETLERLLRKTGIITLLKIESYGGKDIRWHSCFQTEDEVLLPAASKFQVISNYQQSSDLRAIQLKEIAPTSSLHMDISRDLLPIQNDFLE